MVPDSPVIHIKPFVRSRVSVLATSFWSRERAHPAKDAPMVVIGFGDPVLQLVDWA
jgi:hypothetical protein